MIKLQKLKELSVHLRKIRQSQPKVSLLEAQEQTRKVMDAIRRSVIKIS